MIRFFRKTDKTHLRSPSKYEPGTWVYAENPKLEEVENLVHLLGLDGGHIADAQDTDEMPRLEREEDQLYFFTRMPFTNDELHLETTPILFVIAPKFLLTLTNRPMPKLERFTEERIQFNTTHPEHLVLTIMAELLDQYDLYLNQVSRQIKSIRSRLRNSEINNRDFIDFALVEDELNEVLAALTPTAAILKRLLVNKHLRLTEADHEQIEDLILASEQLIEGAKSSTKSIVNIREVYSAIMTNNLNRIIRILTVLTVLLSILTFITGLFGMNVIVPLHAHEHAFTILLVGSLSLVLILFWLFRRNRWL